jgi:hypothetical protein
MVAGSMTTEQHVKLRNIKLKQYMFLLTESLPPTCRGVCMPSSRYLIEMAEFLSRVLLLAAEPETFRSHFRDI